MEGLEPPHLTASDPKSDVSTNFTTSGVKIPNSMLKFSNWNLVFGICYFLFGAANVEDFTHKKRLFFSKFAFCH